VNRPVSSAKRSAPWTLLRNWSFHRRAWIPFSGDNQEDHGLARGSVAIVDWCFSFARRYCVTHHVFCLISQQPPRQFENTEQLALPPRPRSDQGPEGAGAQQGRCYIDVALHG